MFADRRDAGRRLAAELAALGLADPVVLALPRGGVVVAAEVASALGAPLDLVLVRKLGAPGHEELAAGAVVDGASPTVVRNEDVIRAYRIGDAELAAEVGRQLALIERRRRLYLGDRPPVPAAGRTAVVVDDGIATGATVRAALRAVRAQGPRELVLAAPVAPPEALRDLRAECDRVVCLESPPYFRAVGQFYADFAQVEDEEVVALLAAVAP
jgi:putative phosphoribosyl transferase